MTPSSAVTDVSHVDRAERAADHGRNLLDPIGGLSRYPRLVPARPAPAPRSRCCIQNAAASRA